MRRPRLNALAAKTSAAAVVASIESAEADSDAGTVVIRVAIIRPPTRTIHRIAGPIVSRGPARGVRTGLLGLIVAGSDVAEGLRRALRRDNNRVLNPEGENLFGRDVSRVAAGQQHADDSGSCAGARSDGGALSLFMPPCRSGTDNCANAGGSTDSNRIAAFGSASVAVDQRSAERNLIAVDQRQIGKFHPQTRGSGDAPRFLRIRDPALNGLTAVRHHDAIHDDGVNQRCGKGVACLVVI